MFLYKFINEPDFNIKKEIVDNIFINIGKKIEAKHYGIINIVFYDDEEIKKLNKEYRSIDKVTDVLSFHYYEDFSKIKNEDVAGEIIISENILRINGEEYGLGIEKEFYKILIHSILHILGYDHENDEDYEKMSKFENKIWEEVFEK